ncbi:MAG: TatD family hydrolase [Oscillospiraceae bacterium]|nr:TatD family hydrolase [Oscillospiraceae bacterium]
MIFDTHAHYDSPHFDADREELLTALPSQGVCGVLSCADSEKSCREALSLAEKYDYIYAACGVHPHNAKDIDWTEFESALRQYLAHPKCVCLGEIGLDYHYDFSPREKQRELFEQQLALALELDKPVCVHIREATGEVTEILGKYRPRGVVHCFTGSVETAKILLNMGLYLGFGGAVTFKNARKPREAAAYCPLESMLLETDAPYMTPVPFRGKRCDSRHIKYTAQMIGDMKNIDPAALLAKTAANARELFEV